MGLMGSFQIFISFLNLIVFYGALVVVLWKLQKLTGDVGSLKRSITDLQELIMQMPRPQVPTRSE